MDDSKCLQERILKIWLTAKQNCSFSKLAWTVSGHIENCGAEWASSRLQLPLMTSSEANDNISPSKLHRPRNTMFVLEQSCFSTRTSQRMDSLDSHEIPALAHIATPAPVTENMSVTTTSVWRMREKCWWNYDWKWIPCIQGISTHYAVTQSKSFNQDRSANILNLWTHDLDRTPLIV